jgi:hypothetical protein
MDSKKLQTIFNNHFEEFVTDVQKVFPDDVDLLTAKNSLLAIRKMNPRMIVQIWKKYINAHYKTEIEAGNLKFFLEKDYRTDIKDTGNAEMIAKSIDRLRGPIREMSEENQKKAMQYIQNLTKLADSITT